MNNCINCKNLAIDKKTQKYFCKEWSPHLTIYKFSFFFPEKGKIWVDWPNTQSCGTENIGYGTGKFFNKKAHNRVIKLNKLGI